MIEWTERTWNPIAGCTRVSAGCDHCYAVTMTPAEWPEDLRVREYPQEVKEVPF